MYVCIYIYRLYVYMYFMRSSLRVGRLTRHGKNTIMINVMVLTTGSNNYHYCNNVRTLVHRCRQIFESLHYVNMYYKFNIVGT